MESIDPDKEKDKNCNAVQINIFTTLNVFISTTFVVVSFGLVK